MTLVVARIVDGHIRIVSDTHVTLNERARIAPANDVAPTRVLKAVILDLHTCVCFAGDVDRAQIAVDEWCEGMSRDATVDHFAAQQRQYASAAPDFIVASWGTEVSITKISNGAAGMRRQVAMAGESAAFERYQAAFQAEKAVVDVAKTASEGARMASAMEAVVADVSVPTVDGPVVSIATEADGFRSMEGVCATGLGAVPGSSVLRVQTAAEGGYAYQMMVPSEPGIGAIGIYYWQGRFGHLYFPRRSRRTIEFANVSSEGFVKQVREDFGFSLSSPVIG